MARIKFCKIIKRNYWKHVMLSLLFAISQPTLAENSFYEIQYMIIDSSFGALKYEPNALLYKHVIPYNDLINLEGIVALGISEDSEDLKTGFAGPYTQKLKLSNMLGVMASIWGEMEPSVHAFVHVGLVRVDFDMSTSVGGPDGSQNHTGLGYGIGMSFHLLKKGAFVLEYNDLPDVDTSSSKLKNTAVSIGYQLPF